MANFISYHFSIQIRLLTILSVNYPHTQPRQKIFPLNLIRQTGGKGKPINSLNGPMHAIKKSALITSAIVCCIQESFFLLCQILSPIGKNNLWETTYSTIQDVHNCFYHWFFMSILGKQVRIRPCQFNSLFNGPDRPYILLIPKKIKIN